jgi:hypothetical protein
MTTFSSQYKLSKNILFYIVQRHRSESGKMAANLRRGSESGGGVMLSNMTSKQKFILFQKFFCYHAKYWNFSQLLPKTGGLKCPNCYVVCIVVMNSKRRLIEKFGGSRRTNSGSYNTNKSIIQIVIPTQGRSSWGTWFPLFLAAIEKSFNI